MGINSPLPVRLQEETRKAAKILRSFIDSSNNGLDKVIPHSVLERAAGFAIFTVVKAGFVFSARAGAGVVIAKLDDGSWSPPSAIGLGGFGFGGQAGAEVTDFLIVLNSRAAVSTFMSAGSLTLGGNFSVAVGPLGRNAEGSGSLNTKGRIAAMYSYSKTKGLFGGVSVEGSVIVERQDANRIAYGGNPSVKQILSGTFDPPDWAWVLIDELERCTRSRTAKWRKADEEGEYGPGAGGYDGGHGNYDKEGDLRNGSPDRANGDKGGNRSRAGSTGSYAFGDGIGAGGNTPAATPQRKRTGSLFGPGAAAVEKHDTGRNSPRPNARRTSSFNPFSKDGTSSPRKGGVLPSSENYNAGLTWDSSGPMQYGNRSRSGSAARDLRDEDLLGDWEGGQGSKGGDRNGNGNGNGQDLLGTWGADEKGLAASFAKLSTNGNGNGFGNSSGHGSPSRTPASGRSRAGTLSRHAEEEGEYVPFETESRLAKLAPAERRFASPSKTPYGAARNDSPFGENTERTPFDDYPAAIRTTPPLHDTRRSLGPKPNLALKAGLNENDGYARAVALFAFEATAAGDLGFIKGDIVIVLDKVGKGDWWLGRNTSGAEGIFPSNYVEVLSLPKDLRGGVSRGELKGRMASLPFD